MVPQSTTAFGIALESVVNAYRLGMEGEASEHLVALIDILQGRLSKAPPELVLELNPVLAEALGAIERKDYLRAADMFEYEIAPLFMPPDDSPAASIDAEEQHPPEGRLEVPRFSKKGRALIAMYAAMADKGYERTDRTKVEDAFSDFELRAYRKTVRTVFQQQNIRTVLDYGCGGSNWRANGFDGDTGQSAIDFFNLQHAYHYEPSRAVDERRRVDCVISFDVLEHIFITDVPAVLRNMFSYAEKLLFLNVACYPAAAKLPNGENAHVTVRDPLWWKGMIDGISVDYPRVRVYLMCSTGWRDSAAYPLWSAEMWYQETAFVINY